MKKISSNRYVLTFVGLFSALTLFGNNTSNSAWSHIVVRAILFGLMIGCFAQLGVLIERNKKKI